MAKQVQPKINSISPEAINETLEAVSSQILPDGMRLVWRSVDDVREQDVNAQAMPKGMMDQLVSNIKDSGAPEGTPLLVSSDKGVEIISGHHRIRATRAAGIKFFLALEYTNLSASRIKAKQLAHNSIVGKSDPELVKQIWEQIDEVNARFEAYIDPRLFEALKPVSFKPIDVSLDKSMKVVLLMFLPTQCDDFDSAVKALVPNCDLDAVYMTEFEAYKPWMDALAKLREGLDIVLVPSAIAAMSRLAIEKFREDHPEDVLSLDEGN